MAKRALALDLGSSSVRAIVFEVDGSGAVGAVEGALARRPRHLLAREPGQATFDADDYLADLVACIDELHTRGCLDGVTEVAADSQWHSAVAVGPDGAPMSELLTWADTRAQPRHRSGAGGRPGPGFSEERLEQLRQRTGCASGPMYWTSKVPWLAARVSGRPTGYVGLSEYVGARLLDDPSMSVSMASGTGLLATAEHRWDAEALELAGLEERQLPPLAPRGWRGRLAPQWRRRWPQLATALWHPVIGDGAAANLGVGCDGPGQAALTVGTSAAVRSVRHAPDPGPLPAGLWRYCVDHDRVVVGAAYSSGGQLYSWALSLWEGVGTAATGHRAGAAEAAGNVAAAVDYDIDEPAPAGSHGVMVMPWHAGTRAPAAPVPAGQGCITGLGLGHTGAEIVSAAVEAVCFQLAGGLDDLEKGAGAGGRLEVVANGGAIDRSGWWRARLASVLGRPLLCPTVPETTARGAASLVLGPGRGPAGQVGGDRVAVVAPVPADVAVLAGARRRWQQWYDELRPVAARSGGPG